jgi:deoxyribodipyrimidine photolyase-related protein
MTIDFLKIHHKLTGKIQPSTKTIWVLYDQLSWESQVLKETDPKNTCLVFIETSAKPKKRAYHKQKLILILSAMRHFAQEAKEKGFTVLEIFHPDGYLEALKWISQHYGILKIHCMKIAESEVEREVSSWSGLVFTKNNLFLSDTDEFIKLFENKKTYLQETFYRQMRKKYDILLNQDGMPISGKWNLDQENRKPWREGDPIPLPIPWVKPDDLTLQVIHLVKTLYINSYGEAEPFGWPVTRKEALGWLEHFVNHSLVHFGKFEDAMHPEEPYLFHSLLSPLINLGLLHPKEVINRAIDEYNKGSIPLSSVEGFVRQILGWREYMKNVFEINRDQFISSNYFDHKNSLPSIYWGKLSGMRCVDSCINQIWKRGYSHHITRLMVLSNLANLLEVNPHELNEWFWIAYIDAFEWVVTPNVLGMGTYSDGGMTSTKPYIAGANYIQKMAPAYCKTCKYNPKLLLEEEACPLNALYWNFIYKKQEFFTKTRRTDFSFLNWKKFPEEKKQAIVKKAKILQTKLLGIETILE